VRQSNSTWLDRPDRALSRARPVSFKQVRVAHETDPPITGDTMTNSKITPSKLEGSAPILRVSDMAASLRYYVDVLGFKNAPWGNNDFTCVTREVHAGIYLCRGSQGRPGTWVWIGAQDVGTLYEEFQAKGAKIRHAPQNYPWAYEMKVEDPDGHVLRFGSEPLCDQPFEDFTE
jgi:catechol 2,3-dioxygenase-like lactoylglutathione lyase family enzyme